MNTKPTWQVRIGAIRAVIWQNNTKAGVRYNTSFSRLYKDGDKWMSSDSFGRDDLLALAKAADRAHSWICDQIQSAKPSTAQQQPRPEDQQK